MARSRRHTQTTEPSMRSLVALIAGCIALTSTPALAGAGVSPFMAVVSPDVLSPAARTAKDFTGIDAVVVMSQADVDAITWSRYADDRHGNRFIGMVSSSLVPDEVVSATETGFLTGRVWAVADDALVGRLVDSALVGPCGHEPEMVGLVQGDLLSRSVVHHTGVDTAEAAVAVGEYGLSTSPVTDISARITGVDAVTIINPDSMDEGGWCRANPTPHP